MSGAAGDRPGPRARGHRRRRTARRTAVDLLYQADITERPAVEVVGEWKAAGRRIRPYAEEIAFGVQERLSEIDALLGAHSEEWTVHRMAVVDRTILRVACWELLAGVPAGVAINEAVEAAKELSTEDSGRFINGVLGRVAREVGVDPEGEGR